MLILFFTPECGLGDNKCSQLTFNTITRMEIYKITNIEEVKTGLENNNLPIVVKQDDDDEIKEINVIDIFDHDYKEPTVVGEDDYYPFANYKVGDIVPGIDIYNVTVEVDGRERDAYIDLLEETIEIDW